VINHSNEEIQEAMNSFWNKPYEDIFMAKVGRELAETVRRHAMESEVVYPNVKLGPRARPAFFQIDSVEFFKISAECAIFKNHDLVLSLMSCLEQFQELFCKDYPAALIKVSAVGRKTRREPITVRSVNPSNRSRSVGKC
jgi:hypothetical protein